MASFIALAFNPQAWVVVGLALFLGFSSGVVKGVNWSNAEEWRLAASAAQEAAKTKERLSEADRARAEAAEADLARSDATLESFIHETKNAPSTCRFAPVELMRLQQLAAASGKRR